MIQDLLATQHCSGDLARAYQAGVRLARDFSVRPASSNYPALEQWLGELAAGIRTTLDFDDLWREACEEMNLLEAGARPSFITESFLPRTPPAATVMNDG